QRFDFDRLSNAPVHIESCSLPMCTHWIPLITPGPDVPVFLPCGPFDLNKNLCCEVIKPAMGDSRANSPDGAFYAPRWQRSLPGCRRSPEWRTKCQSQQIGRASCRERV